MRAIDGHRDNGLGSVSRDIRLLNSERLGRRVAEGCCFVWAVVVQLHTATHTRSVTTTSSHTCTPLNITQRVRCAALRRDYSRPSLVYLRTLQTHRSGFSLGLDSRSRIYAPAAC